MPSLLRPVTENWQLKLLALALAVLLWVVVSAEQVTSQWIPIPLQIRENDPDFQLISADLPSEVEVRFTGSGRDLVDVAIRKPPLVLSIDQVEQPAQEFRLSPAMVQVPSQLNVNAQEIRSPVIHLSFRRLSMRTLPIRPTVDTDVPGDWTLVDTLQLLPTHVEIRGPAERVETADAVRTVPFTLPASDSVFSMLVPIDTANLRDLDLSVHQVRISGRVDRVVQRRLADVPISVGAGIVVRPRVVDVVLTGPRSVVERITPASFRVVIAIEGIPAHVPPEGISVPLRMEQLPISVTASVVPPAVRLLPAVRPEVDTTAVPRSPPDSAGPGEQ